MQSEELIKDINHFEDPHPSKCSIFKEIIGPIGFVQIFITVHYWEDLTLSKFRTLFNFIADDIKVENMEATEKL